MANGQLTLIILASVLVGALLPVLVALALALFRAASGIAQVMPKMARTLTQIETIANRGEQLSRVFKDGEADIADLLTAVGKLARGIERNLRVVNVVSGIAAAIGPAIAAFVGARAAPEVPAEPHGSTDRTSCDPAPAPSAAGVRAEEPAGAGEQRRAS